MFGRFIGQKVIVRADDAGVHFGTLKAASANGSVELANSRRLWRWKTLMGISLSDVAFWGIDDSGSKICQVIPFHGVIGVCEIIPCTQDAIMTIENAPVAEAE